MMPTISAISDEDRKKLIGKKAAGLTLEYGRCTFCGHPKSSCPEWDFFCSDDCKQKGLRPHLPSGWDWNARLEDDPEYQTAIEHARAVRYDSDYEEIARELGVKQSRSEMTAIMSQKIEKLQKNWERYRGNKVWSAANVYAERWIHERDTVLARERDKEAIDHAKEQAKQATAREEEDRWKPRLFEP